MTDALGVADDALLARMIEVSRADLERRRRERASARRAAEMIALLQN